MTKSVKVVISVPLRDFSSFEDLAQELGCQIEVIELVKRKSPRPRPDGSSGRNAMTPEVVAKIKKYWDRHEDAKAPEVKKALDLPHGTSTIQKVRGGYYD